jgi:peptidoglycan/xylan/chitin deacetylase (PgdA/CDA1 family)
MSNQLVNRAKTERWKKSQGCSECTFARRLWKIAAASGSRQPHTLWKGETLANRGGWRKGKPGQGTAEKQANFIANGTHSRKSGCVRAISGLICDVAMSYRLIAIGCLLITLVHGTSAQAAPADHLVRDKYGAIIRGDVNAKKLALIFTGGDFGESTGPILDTLKERKIKGGLFITGDFIRNKKLRPLLERAIAEGHYVGPHSDSHPLYASWDERDKTLVTEEFFKKDLKKNLASLGAIGALKRDHPVFFIPPYEYYNRDQVQWSRKLDVTLFNFTPGSGSNRDYIKEGAPHFVSAQRLYDDILAYERKDPHGLNGFLLLIHLGSGRKDPFHPMLGPLCDELLKRGYTLERVDKLLK